MIGKSLFSAGVLCVALLIVLTPHISAQDALLTNDEVVNLTKAGLDKDIIIAKIKSSRAGFDLSTEALIKLKEAGVASEVIATMFALAVPQESAKPKKMRDGFGEMFKELKNSVVTVWSEFSHGTGFIISKHGLILTNYHVLGPTRHTSVQFDPEKKVEAVILATSPKDDIAVLWADISAFEEAVAVPLFSSEGGGLIEEGERVMAIGSPLNQTKIMTTGVVSKLEEKAILSDVSINQGNSGGPLFNSLGEVIGINTFVDAGDFGSGVSGVVRIELARPLVAEALKVASTKEKPSSRLLPVEPAGEYPIEAIKHVATLPKFDFDPYMFNVGKFTMTMMTPVLVYRMETEAERQALKGRGGREKKSEIKGTFNAFDDFYGWRQYVGDYKPMLIIKAVPEMGETGGSIFTRALIGGLTGVVPPGGKFRYKADFYKMKLFCGDKEVEPIQPGRVARMVNSNNYFININDATYFGVYSYPADAINDSCGKVRVEIYSEQKPNEAQVENVKPKYIQKLVQDFKPYFDAKSAKSNEKVSSDNK